MPRRADHAEDQVVFEYSRPLNSRQAAEYLGVSRKCVAEWAASGLLPAVKLGNRWRFSQRRLAEFIDVVD